MKIRLFNDADRRILSTLVYDDRLRPDFDAGKHCLVWADEYSPQLSSLGHEILYDLWIARGYVHLGKPFHTRPLGGDYYRALWASALNSDVPWNGFRRLKLNGADNDFLKGMCRRYEQPGGVL